MLSTRNPYPFPAYEGDDDFIGKSCTKQKTFQQPSAQEEEKWNRLTYASTVSSAQKEASSDNSRALRDSLDLALETEYDQHREFLKDKSETLLQKETLRQTSGNSQKSGSGQSHAGKVKQQTHGHPVRIIEGERREHPSSVKTAISSHHTQTTNVGYSRKPDGGFYVA